MKSLLLLSILIGGIAIPVILARDPNPQRAQKRLLLLLLLFNALYFVYVTMVHSVLFVPGS